MPCSSEDRWCADVGQEGHLRLLQTEGSTLVLQQMLKTRSSASLELAFLKKLVKWLNWVLERVSNQGDIRAKQLDRSEGATCTEKVCPTRDLNHWHLIFPVLVTSEGGTETFSTSLATPPRLGAVLGLKAGLSSRHKAKGQRLVTALS